jgi:hypothetical protein
MTLPEMAQQALRRKHSDAQIRLVFPVENWALERSDAADRLILTFSTPDGFRASFALFLDELVDMVGTALSDKDVTGTEPETTARAN